MYDITVITPTLGRRSILRLIESLKRQDVKVLHLIMWDKKRCEDSLLPDDSIFRNYHSDNYISYHYIHTHPIYDIKRIDNYLRYNGIMMTTTNYITQIDDDCWLEDNWLYNAIKEIKENELDYIFCQRNLWKDEENKLGIDNYESIGIINKFGYQLMETNSIVFTKNISLHICNITYQYNQYGHDRYIAQYLIDKCKGIYYQSSGLNQIIPEFLLEFHKNNIKN